MAKTATILKAHIQIADMDRHYYNDHSMTLAQHPSETDERLMMRIIAFIKQAEEDLTFTKGMDDDNVPDLWVKSLTDEIDTWIDVGLPSEDRIRKACNRSKKVVLFTYGNRTAPIWWQKIENSLSRFKNLTVIYLPDSEQISELISRGMHLQANIQDGELFLGNDKMSVTLNFEQWK
jgi:uncharacterized protein YaeQ